jgi:hypothetical protein
MLRTCNLLLVVLLLTCACQAGAVHPEPTSTNTPLPAKTSTRTSIPSETPLPPTLTSTATQSPIPPSPTSTFSPSPIPVTTLLFTGVIVPARCVQAALDEMENPDYPYDEVREVISEADLAIGTFNATMSDKVEHTGCVYTYQLVGSPSNADAMARAGFDVMSVATNHIKDCGLMKAWCEYTFFDTLENLQRVEIVPVGAGANLAAAIHPKVVEVNGIRFGFVSLGDSKLSVTVFADEDSPGIAELTEENINSAIDEARQVSDVVIALPHWGSEDNFVPNWNQREQAQQLVAAGADLVVGNHTHVVQALQEIDGIPVFYGLGNFVFDQGLRPNRQGVILLIKFKGTQYIGYELIPTHVDPDGRVHIADPEEAAEILENIDNSSRILN